MNKILTLDDLVKFCAEQKVKKFSSKESGYKLRVQVPAKFEMDEETSTSTLFAHIQIMHTGRNRNGSNLTEKAAKECLSSIPYKPLLANFCEIDGVKDFTSHDFTINEDGEIEYQERQIGCFTADKAYMEDDKEVEGRKNIFAKVAIPREYTDAAEIIERKNGTKVSAELEINSMSYDSKEKELLLESVELIGCTCLGVNPETGEEVLEGMENSHIQLEDFSAENNSSRFSIDENIKKFIQVSIEEALNNKSKGKEDQTMEFEENAKVTEEETVTEEFADAESVDETSEETVTEESNEESTIVTEAQAEDTDDAVSPETEEFDADTADDDEDEGTEDSDEESSEESDDTDEAGDADVEETDAELNCLKMSVNVNGEVRTFSVSLIDKLNALYTLVNETYSEADNDYYDIDAYEDDKIVLMHGWFSGKHYRQQYSVKKDVFSLKGDRVEVFATYLTKDEQAQLETMKTNYSSTMDELAQYKAEPEKLELLNSDRYDLIREQEDFAKLTQREGYFNLSIDEIKEKADSILLEYAATGLKDYSAKTETETADKKTVSRKPFSIIPKRKNYGSLLDV